MKQIYNTFKTVILLLFLTLGFTNAWGQSYHDDAWYSLYDTNVYSESTTNISGVTIHTYSNAFVPNSGEFSFDSKLPGNANSSKQKSDSDPNDWGVENYQINFGGKSVDVAQNVSATPERSGKGTLLSPYKWTFHYTYNYKSVSGSGLNSESSSFVAKYVYKLSNALFRTVYITNVKVPMAKHIRLVSGTYGTTSITNVDLGSAVYGKTSSTVYHINLRSFYVDGTSIKYESNNPEFHFGTGSTIANGKASITKSVKAKSCAAAGGTANCASTDSELGNPDNQEVDVYFTPGSNKNGSSTATVTIYDGSTARATITFTAKVEPTYYFKATTVATTGSNEINSIPVRASFTEGSYSAASATTSMTNGVDKDNLSITAYYYAPASSGNYQFEGWYADAACATERLSTESVLTRTITATSLNSASPTETKYYAKYLESITAEFSGEDQELKVGETYDGISYIRTSAVEASASNEDNLWFEYVNNTPTGITTGSNNASQIISYNPSTKVVTAHNAGTAKLILHQKAVGLYEQVDKEYTFTVNKHKNAVKVNGEADYEASVYYDDGLLVTFTSLNDNNPTAAYSVKQDEGATFATYYNNENGQYIWTAPTQGKAVWTVTQAEDYKFESASTTMTVNVIPAQAANDCYVLNETAEQTLTTHISSTGGVQGQAMALSGQGATLTFQAKKTITAISNLFVEYSSDGQRWDDLGEPSLSELGIYQDYSYDISNLDVKYIRFEAKVGATYTKTIRNVRVTRKAYVTPSFETLIIDKNSNNEYICSGQTGSAQLTIDWSCANGGNLELYCSDTRFRFEPSVIENVDCNGGKTTVTVYYDANTAEDVEATLYIHNSVYSEQVELTGKARLHTQTINWADDIDVMQKGTSRDDAASAMTTISYVSGNPDVIRVDNNTTLVAVGVGSALITATAAAEGAYAEATDSKLITVTNDQPQYILWNQSLIGLHVGDANVTLNATATSDVEGCTTNGQRTITYTAQDENVVKIVKGNQLQIVGVGTTSVIATQVGGEDEDGHNYLAVSKENKVVVTNPSAECDAIIPIAETSASLFDWNTNKPQVQFDIELNPATNGEPRSVSFDCKTEKFSGIWLNGDLILAQKINGSWVDVRNFGVPTTGEYDQYEDIALDRNATAIRFYRPKGGTGYHDVANVVVKKARYIETALDSYSLNTKVGETTTQSVTINYSNVIGPVTFQLSGENNHFAIDNNVENAFCGQNGSVTIQLSYTPSAAVAEETDLLTITDGQIKTEVEISGSASLTQRSIIWTPELPSSLTNNQTLTLAAICKTEYDLIAGDVHFRLTDNSTTGTLNGNVLSFAEAGVVEIEAYVDEDARYNTPTSIVTITVNAAPEYIFTGSGSWQETGEWKNGSVPSENVNIQVTGQLVIEEDHVVNNLTILGDGSVTMVENATLTINGTSKTETTYGDLYVNAGGEVIVNGTLKVNDLIIAAEYPATGTAKSGQLENSQNVDVQQNVYFDLTIDTTGTPTYGFYDFSVPFAVDAVNGVSRYNKSTEVATKASYGPEYAIIDFNAEQYANGGRGWNYFRGIMQPGTLYSITVDDEYTGADRNTYRFRKASGTVARIQTLPLSTTSGEDTKRINWNGLGNTMLQYAKVNTKTQVYDHTNNRYKTIEANERTFVIGEAFFVQSEETELNFTAVSNNNILKAPARASRVIDEFILSLTKEDAEQDRLFLSASEDARETYHIGHDLVKFGTPTEAKVAQLWSTAYNEKLCDVELPLRANKAVFDINLFAPKAGTYTLSISQQPTDATLYLTMNNSIIWNLSMSDYEVELPEGTTTNYGLMLRANEEVQQVTTDIEGAEINQSNVSKLIIDGQLYIIRDGKMFDVQGRRVKE